MSRTLNATGAYNSEFALVEDYDYCVPQFPVKMDYEPLPNGKLRHVQMIIRHGERVTKRSFPGMRNHWECTPQYDYCYLPGGTKVPAGTNIHENIMMGRPLEDSIVARQAVFSPADSHYPGFMSGTCETGQLTERGMVQARLLELIGQLQGPGTLPRGTKAESTGDNNTPPKFELYSANDNSLVSLLSALGQQDLAWVQYTLQLIFEYWDISNGAVVRALYNGRPVVSIKADFSSLPLEDFQKLLESYIRHDFGACQVVPENSGGWTWRSSTKNLYICSILVILWCSYTFTV
ncbi:hypothetical protein IWQ61_000830 [Dispira simplex]|nr:hypothetical protein IWQ61_000830 [Dispira simplex]